MSKFSLAETKVLFKYINLIIIGIHITLEVNVMGNKMVSLMTRSCLPRLPSLHVARLGRRAVNEMFDAMERDMMVPWGGYQGYPPQRGPFPPSYGSEYGVSLDMHETPEGFELSADLPGMRKEDIAIDVDNDTRVLTVSAERKNAQGADDNGFNSQRRYSRIDP